MADASLAAAPEPPQQPQVALSLSCCHLWQFQEPAVAAEAITATAAKDSYHGLAILTDSQGAAVPCPPAWPLHSLQRRLPRQHWLPSTPYEGHFSLACSAKAVKSMQQCVLSWHLGNINLQSHSYRPHMWPNRCCQ